MVAAPVRRTTASKNRSPAKERKSATRTQSAEASLVSSSAPSSPGKTETPRTARYSHHLPTNQQRKGNGRVPGRNLIMWNRPRMAEKLLLHIHYECTRHRLQLPWDAIAHRFHPGSSGAAIIQHINRLRREILAEGHLVPPLTQRSSATPVDPNVRGFVRQDTECGDIEATRPVYFGERIDDPKFSLPCDLSFLDEEESMEPQAGLGTSSAGSDEGDSRQDSPTPMTRCGSKSSIGSMSAYETFAPQFVAPVELVRDRRGLDLSHFPIVGQQVVETEPNHGRHLPHGSESVANSFEGIASPGEPLETSLPVIAPGHFALPGIPEHAHHGCRMSTLQSLAHPFVYQMSHHQDCLRAAFHMGMPFAMTSPYDPYMALDPGLMKQSIGQPLPAAATAENQATMRGDIEAADVSTPLPAISGPALSQTIQ
ncbi:uncharacterized protein MAM_01050 [Metarhizium album ARSEF 1941]|uniref:Uncharacterized protein n=1 Tax=Metarhizium album (strain ARSEF 1941) TaxID=1081103 RepID=A0A0B2X6N0_METAS|nr:uncharacterized protein MAM_01050 [Metarhizium album ARSEF 1941]KHO02049.1 hypothetical protein MAM_01050 [Metarhizium album ARSEF 1941]